MARNTITRYERGFLSIPKYVDLAVTGLRAELRSDNRVLPAGLHELT